MTQAQFNRHSWDYRCDFTIEFSVKGINRYSLPEDVWQYEYETGAFTNKYGQKCFDEIARMMKKIKSWSVDDWSFGGRSNGWFILVCGGARDKVTQLQLDKITEVVTRFIDNYNLELENYYLHDTFEIVIDHAADICNYYQTVLSEVEFGLQFLDFDRIEVYRYPGCTLCSHEIESHVRDTAYSIYKGG